MVALSVQKIVLEAKEKSILSMIEREKRNRLAELIRHVSAGTMTISTFMKESCRVAECTEDSGILAVLLVVNDFCENEDAPTWPDRFRGRHKLAPEIRDKMAIAIVFLYSDLEYEWPEDLGYLGPPAGDCLLMLLCVLFVIGGFFTLTMSLIQPLFLFGVLICITMATLIYRYSQKLTAKAYARWEKSLKPIGDFDVWPFIRRADFDEARKHPRLLRGDVGC